MSIKIVNGKEYVISKIALCGEIVKANASAPLPYSTVYIRREINELVEKGAISAYRYSDRRLFYRLREPVGFQMLENISPELFTHAEDLIGIGKHYNADKKTQLRKRRKHEVYEMMVDLGFTFDGVNLLAIKEQKKYEGWLPYRDGQIATTEEIMKNQQSDTPSFIGSKLLTVRPNCSVKNRMYSSRSIGFLISGKQIYSVYSFGKANERWHLEAERSANFEVYGNAAKYLPCFKNENVEPIEQSILYLPNEQEIAELFKIEFETERNSLTSIYRHVYVLPLNKGSTPTRLLTYSKWNRQIIKLLFADAELSSKVEDATLFDGTKIYNLLGCDLNRIKYLIGRIRPEQRNIILVHDWMNSFIKDIVGTRNTEFISLKNEDLDSLLLAMK